MLPCFVVNKDYHFSIFIHLREFSVLLLIVCTVYFFAFFVILYFKIKY